MKDDIFEEYSKEKEPTKYYKTYAWKTAIGLQKVDGLEPSEYLVKTAEQNINGDISFDDAHALITSYYKENKIKSERAEEADKVSVRIAQIISEKSFVFSLIKILCYKSTKIIPTKKPVKIASAGSLLLYISIASGINSPKIT